MDAAIMLILGLLDIPPMRKKKIQKKMCARCGSYETKTHFAPPTGEYYVCQNCGHNSRPKWWY